MPELEVYDDEPNCPPTIELIRWHVSEAGRLIDEWMEWMKTNEKEFSMGMKTPVELGAFAFWANPDDADYDNYDRLVALTQFADRITPMPCSPQSGGAGDQND